ncbi:MAG: hypothetical protein EP344_11240 [Bacteroidetes bacterium]|nr:MAG: hypothetical protein EP344_11240 [Bacteroidota bacterium]
MEKARLWQTLSTLSALERKHLEQWLCSPFFCRQEPPLRLYRFLKRCLEQGRIPDQTQAYQTVFGADKPFRAQALRQIMSALMTQVEHFLVYQQKFEQTADYGVCLAGAYRKRGLAKHFRQSLQAARTDWARQPYRHAEYFDAQAAIEYEQYQQLSASRRTEALNWQELADQTDLAYISRKLRQACFGLSHQTVYNTDYQFGMLDAVLEYVRHSPELREIPAIGLYYFCYLFLTEPEGRAEVYFTRFKTQLLAQADPLPLEEQRNLYLLAINFCIRKINQLEQAYFREALDLYQYALKAELLLENGRLSAFAYNNIVAIALKVNETDWAETFIHSYAPFLEKKKRESSLHLNLARVEYSRGLYRSALLHLQEADYKDLINNLIAKTLQLKIYYETEEFDALDAHLQSMQTYIRRLRVIGYHKTNYKNIVRYARRLMQLNPANRQAAASLRNQIETEPVLTEKEWFLAMLSEEGGQRQAPIPK